MNNGITVLSLFDGISCGMIALERADIPVNKYFAYEIDSYAIQISKKNYPQIEHCGDVTTADFTQYQGVDLLIGGSPCQDLCNMGSHKGLDGEKSSLFFEFVRALREAKPRFFLLENNASMTNKNKDIISSYMGVEPIFIDSIDFSAQHRKRLYWTNIPFEQYESKRITIRDIAQSREEKNEYDITETVRKYLSSEYEGRKIQKTVSSKIRTLDGVSKCLGTYCGDYGNNTGLIIQYDDGRYFSITPIEAERLQTLPDNYTEGVPPKKRFFGIGNGWTVDVITHTLQGIKPYLPQTRSAWLYALLEV